MRDGIGEVVKHRVPVSGRRVQRHTVGIPLLGTVPVREQVGRPVVVTRIHEHAGARGRPIEANYAHERIVFSTGVFQQRGSNSHSLRRANHFQVAQKQRAALSLIEDQRDLRHIGHFDPFERRKGNAYRGHGHQSREDFAKKLAVPGQANRIPEGRFALPGHYRCAVSHPVGDSHTEPLWFAGFVQRGEWINGRSQAECREPAQIAFAFGHGEAQFAALLFPAQDDHGGIARHRQIRALARFGARLVRGQKVAFPAIADKEAGSRNRPAQSVGRQFFLTGRDEDGPAIVCGGHRGYQAGRTKQLIRGRRLHLHAQRGRRLLPGHGVE